MLVMFYPSLNLSPLVSLGFFMGWTRGAYLWQCFLCALLSCSQTSTVLHVKVLAELLMLIFLSSPAAPSLVDKIQSEETEKGLLSMPSCDKLFPHPSEGGTEALVCDQFQKCAL